MSDGFWSSVGHELRNPLSTILVQAEALSDEVYGPLQASQLWAVQSIQESVTSTLEMIRDLVELFQGRSNSEAGESSVCHPHSMIEKARELNADQTKLRSIELVNQSDENGTIELGNEDSVQRVITKMLGLLLLVLPSRSKVELSVSKSPTDLLIEAKVGLAEGLLATDSIEEDAGSSRLLDGARNIMPIGFALVAQVVRSLHGEWKVRSSGGEVTAFSIILPI